MHDRTQTKPPRHIAAGVALLAAAALLIAVVIAATIAGPL